MPDEATNPAQATEVPSVEPGAAPDATAQAQATAPAPKAPKTVEPDFDSLLGNEDFVSRVLQHPKAQQRIKSVRQADIDRLAEERAATRADQLLRQRDAVYANQRQREERVRELQDELRVLDEDATHPIAQKRRPAIERELGQIREVEAKERAANELRPSIEQQAFQQANHQFIAAIGQHLSESGAFTEAELGELSPFADKYVGQGPVVGFRAWLKDVMEGMTKKQAIALAEKLVKDKLPSEVEAAVQERLGKDREKAAGVVTLPQGVAGATYADKYEVYRAWNDGNFGDHSSPQARKAFQDALGRFGASI